MLTLEERERRAYIAGDVAVASLLTEVMDSTDNRIDELEHEVRGLEDEVRGLEDELKTTELTLSEKYDEIDELESQLAHALG